MVRGVVLLILAGAIFDLCGCQIISIPLFRAKSARQAMAEVGTSIEDVLRADKPLSKYSYLYDTSDTDESGKPKPTPRKNDSIALFKYLDSEFYGKISIGRPAQTFSVVFDTAWSNSWVPSSQCSFLNIPCLLHNKYNHKKSLSYQENGTAFIVNLGWSNLTGFLSTDDINLAHLKIKNQTFAEIVSVPLLYLFSKADGVLGMAYSSFSVDGVLPFFYNLVKQNLVAQPIFSFYINSDRTTDRAGNLFLGGADPKHYNGSMTFVPVTEKAYWQFKMSGVFIEVNVNTSVPFCANGCDAIVDTSTTVISGPAKEVDKLNTILVAVPLALGRYKVNCGTINKLPEISFLIGGKNFTLKARNYIQQITWGGFELCLSAFVATDLAAPYDNLWALGQLSSDNITQSLTWEKTVLVLQNLISRDCLPGNQGSGFIYG